MFVRIKKSGKYRYLQIVQNYRKWREVHQRVIASLGRLDQYTNNADLCELGHHFIALYEKLKKEATPRRRKKKAA